MEKNPFLSSWRWEAVVKNAARPVRFVAGWFDRRPRQASLADWQAKLQNAPADLQSVSKQLEEKFLATGASLEQLTQKGDQFFHLSEKLLNSATGRAGGSTLFYNGMKVVEAPLAFLNRSHGQTGEILRRLKRDNDRISEFNAIQDELQRTIAPLKYIQTLFKIESAPLGQEVQMMFGALTTEIEKLHDQLCELFTTKFHELRDIQHSVSEVIGELQTQTDALWETIAKEEAQIQKSLRELEQQLIENQNREPRISRVSKNVNESIQQVVIGLQYQDIINQKLEHICVALGQIQDGLAARANRIFLDKSCRLEAAQLQAVRKDLAAAEQSVKNGVERILGQLVNADAQCLTLAEFKLLTTSADGMVQVLFDVFETLRKQITATVASSSRAYERLRPIGGLASDLTAVVHELSQRIHLIGLNAQVQAALVQEGAGLEVLSARTSEISRATNHISKDIAAKLDQLVAGLAEGVQALELQHNEALKQRQTLEHEGAKAEKTLHALRDDALSALAQIDTGLEEIRSEASALTGKIDYTAIADPPLAALENELRALAGFFLPDKSSSPAKDAGHVEHFQNGYTMNSERQIFAEVIKGLDATPHRDHNAVELFDVPAAAPSNPANTEAKPPRVPAAVPADASHTKSAGRPADTLGDNVELF